MTLKMLVSLIMFIIFATSLVTANDQPPRYETDLGENGNQFVADTFTQYQRLHPNGICSTAGIGKKIILTGFGLFAGASYNISGSVVASLANLPSVTKWRPSHNLLKTEDFGGVGSTHSYYVNGIKYEVCYLVLDVIWDLASSILIYEAQKFQPDLIFMTGRGDSYASFEQGASNKASKSAGYDSNGNKLDGTVTDRIGTNSLNNPPGMPANIPQAPYVLPDQPVNMTMQMNWDSMALAELTKFDIKKLGYKVKGAQVADPLNDYLCNNISYVALNAANNQQTILAGGKIIFLADLFIKKPTVGFFHFPTVDKEHQKLEEYGSEINSWGKILGAVIGAALR
jgi:pyrrolidone-carboxylate peptidase